MANQIALIAAFQDVRIQVKENERLKKETKKMQAGTRIYLDGFSSVYNEVKCENPIIRVVGDTTFHCAQPMTADGKKTAVLNFANAYRPGGGVTQGATAQEECLCRSSNLYESFMLPYILKHYYKWNDKNTGDKGSDRIIYSPGVTVFKSDDLYPENLPEWFQVDVITCAAPYYDIRKKNAMSIEHLEEIVIRRSRNVLEVAISNDVDNLVLGAWGCGVFNNPPELVAKAFHKLLVKEGYARYFNQVVFAIKKSKDICPNLEAFKKVFE